MSRFFLRGLSSHHKSVLLLGLIVFSAATYGACGSTDERKFGGNAGAGGSAGAGGAQTGGAGGSSGTGGHTGGTSGTGGVGGATGGVAGTGGSNKDASDDGPTSNAM